MSPTGRAFTLYPDTLTYIAARCASNTAWAHGARALSREWGSVANKAFITGDGCPWREELDAAHAIMNHDHPVTNPMEVIEKMSLGQELQS